MSSDAQTPETDLDALIGGLIAGEAHAVRRFCAAYGPALQRIADRRIATPLRPRIDAEDVVQSVYRTFFRRAADGQFALEDASALWRLLCAITLTKVREKARFHTRQRRAPDREVAVDAGVDGPGLQQRAAAPGQDEQLALADAMAQLLADLTPQEQALVDLKLQDVPNHEIAARMGCSERTVRRLLGRLKQQFQQALGGPTG